MKGTIVRPAEEEMPINNYRTMQNKGERQTIIEKMNKQNTGQNTLQICDYKDTQYIDC